MTKRKKPETEIPTLSGVGFEKALEALLRTPPPPKNLGRPKAKKKAGKKR